MEATTLQVSLRVLYTVNSNPQYILAKSSSQIPVHPCGEISLNSLSNEHAYARAPLRACLTAVCDSSPELLQDPARDFSLYFLDPLETQPLPTGLPYTPHNASSPRGVAVALGLMSRALESNDSKDVLVTGTIISNPSPSLEVVCALRETRRMPNPILQSHPSFGPMPAPGSFQPLNVYPPQAAGANWSIGHHLQDGQQQQQTLTRSADFPELYIGPPRRARGRPEGSMSSKPKVKAHGSASSLPGASSLDSKQDAGRSSKQKTKPRSLRGPPTYSPFVCAPLTRNTVLGGPEGHATNTNLLNQKSGTSSQSQAQLYQPQLHPTQTPLLGLLSAISSTCGSAAVNATPEQQAALVSALQGLLSTNPHLLQFAATSSEEKTPQGMQESTNTGDNQDDSGSDIVVLDSATIDTAMFRKSSTRQQTTGSRNSSSLITNCEPVMPGIQFSPLLANTPLSEQETSASSRTSTPSRTLELAQTVADTETPTSSNTSFRRVVRGGGDTSLALDVPSTPTPSRARKRKQDEYVQNQDPLSTPSPPPSPSPSGTRISSLGRTLTTNHRIQSSPTVGTKWMPSPSVRLPSMLGSLRGITASTSRGRVSQNPHRLLAFSTTDSNGTHFPRLSKSKVEHTETTEVFSNGVATDANPLKRRRTLTEVMAERESRKCLKVRKHSSSGRRLEPGISAISSQIASPAQLGSTPRHAQSSPSRPLFRSNSTVSALPLLTSTFQFGLIPGAVSNSASSSTLTSSGASTSTTTAAPPKNPLKDFVMPAWARTSTAMLPRLSEEALARQRAEQEAKKSQVSLRRREAAKAKRRRLGNADRSAKESSDGDEEPVANEAKLRSLRPSSSNIARSAQLLRPSLASLPVFASNVVEPIPSSPPRLGDQSTPAVVPRTPPKTPISLSRSGTRRTPSKSGPFSLFTPSGQDSISLFTPSTPCVTRSVSRSTFTPRSPTGLHRSGETKKSPRKCGLQTPLAPKRSNNDRPILGSSHTDRNLLLGSPSAIRTPRTHTGMGTRAFLLPPPSPCALRTPQRPSLAHPGASGGSTLNMDDDSVQQGPSPDKGEDVLGCKLVEVFNCVDVALLPPQRSPSHDREKSVPPDMISDAHPTEEDYTSSPLPPSSPLPASPLSSPAKHDGISDTHTPSNVALLDSDMFLPSINCSGLQTVFDTAWHSDDASTAAPWFTDSEASAWFTETEAWLTDTEGGLFPTDSDGTGAWLSDSDAMFRDMPPLASNWLSDDADVDTDDGELTMARQGQVNGLDATTLETAYAALVESNRTTPDPGRTQDSELFWKSIQPLLEDGGILSDGGDTAQDIQKLMDDLVGSSA